MLNVINLKIVGGGLISELFTFTDIVSEPVLSEGSIA